MPEKAAPSYTLEMKLSEIDINTYQFKEEAVLCFIKNDNKLLLMHKKRGLGKGKINAPGGRIEKGETPIQAAVRETEEEVCLRPEYLEQRALLNFIFTDGYSMKVHVFFSHNYSGSMAETDEAIPFWCDIQDIPYSEMWEDDVLWLPIVLAGYNLTGNFTFDDDTMLDWELFRS